jgi:hypothetical protein
VGPPHSLKYKKYIYKEQNPNSTHPIPTHRPLLPPTLSQISISLLLSHPAAAPCTGSAVASTHPSVRPPPLPAPTRLPHRRVPPPPPPPPARARLSPLPAPRPLHQGHRCSCADEPPAACYNTTTEGNSSGGSLDGYPCGGRV